MPLINDAINNFNPEVRFACIALAAERKIKAVIIIRLTTTGVNKNDRCERKSELHLHLLDRARYLCHFPCISLHTLSRRVDLNRS